MMTTPMRPALTPMAQLKQRSSTMRSQMQVLCLQFAPQTSRCGQAACSPQPQHSTQLRTW